MKLVALGLISVLLFSASTASAAEPEKAIIQSVVSSYAQQQLRHQLEVFLNKNPQVVFSSSSTVGTQSMKFVGQALAVYGLITAKTDRERAWAAASLLISPEPTSCAILLAAQLVDTLMTIKAQKDLALIYQEIAEIQAKTTKLVVDTALSRLTSQAQLVRNYSLALGTVSDLQVKLVSEPLFKMLNTGDSSWVPTEDDVQNALTEISMLSDALIDLKNSANATKLVEPAVLDALGLEINFSRSAQSVSDEFNPLRVQISKLTLDFYHFFGSLEAEKMKLQISKEIRPYALKLKIYAYCVEVVNAAQTNSYFKIENSIASDDVKSCQSRFLQESGT